MQVKHFLSALEHERIHQAIRTAEAGTSGAIVLFISHRPVEDPLAAAQGEFEKLHLQTAPGKNGLLIFLAPKSQKFAIVGGPALHEKVGQAWWDHLVALLTRHFKAGHYTDGIVAVVEQAGRALRAHFPARPANRAGRRDIIEE